MHKKLIKHATHEQLESFVEDFLSMLKARNFEIFEEAEEYLYKELYGCHFNEFSLKIALEELENEDNTKGGKWSVEQTNSVAKSLGIQFSKFNEYDWNYVMNMVYSDYFGSVPNELETYAKIAKKFIMDKDAPEGKAYKYYLAMKH